MEIKPTAPKGLKAPGRKMWESLTEGYDLRPDELVIVEFACRAFDRTAVMESELGDDVTSLGSMGQVVVHPLIAELRAHAALVASLLKQLALPDENQASATRSTQARAAAQSRWAAAHGATA